MNKLVLLPIFIVMPATAAEVRPERPGCFEIASASENASTLMINRCTGETWVLARTAADENGVFTYQWRPLARVNIPPALSSGASRAEAAQAAAEKAAADQSRRDSQEYLIRIGERDRMRRALGREPTDLEITYCLTKAPGCPAPVPQ